MPSDLNGKRVTVMGLGRFGGGIGAVRFLAERGARVTVTDLSKRETLQESLDAIADVPLECLRLGRHDEADFRDADLIVASPAVTIDHPLLDLARSAGIPVTTEIGIFWSRCRGRIIGVTGSVGKSTTAAMVHAILVAAGKTAWLGGNIGVSLLADIDRIQDEDWVVLELSSFQLEYLAPLQPRPRVAVVTNLSRNHLDRHRTFDAYRAAKQNLLRWQTTEDIAVLNVGDPDVTNWATAARVWWFGKAADDPALADECSRFPSTCSEAKNKTPPAVLALSSDGAFLTHDSHEPYLLFPDLPVSGDHNRLNAAAAIAAPMAIGIPLQSIEEGLRSFRGLPHRLEVVGEFAGRLWVNDSKATTPESAIAALHAFDRPIRLVAGGADKGADFVELANEAACRTAGVYLSGQTASTIAELFAQRGSPATVCRSFEESVIAAFDASNPGDVILLSPACASWGQFRDYRDRGRMFAAIAEGIGSGRFATGRDGPV